MDGRSQEKAEEKVRKVWKKFAVDLMVLARYMRVLTPSFVWRYPNIIIYSHPPLLPAFPARRSSALGNRPAPDDPNARPESIENAKH